MKAARLKSSSTYKPAKVHRPVPVSLLRWQCNPKSLGIKTTDDIPPSHDILGQERALRALRVGLEINHFGYNIFVTGLSGTGRTTTIKRMLHEFEKEEVALFDYCYVNNFNNPDMPHALDFPAGKGRDFKRAMEQYIEDLIQNIPALFESQRYQDARKNVVQLFSERQKIVMSGFEKKVKEQGFNVVQVQMGNVARPDIVPIVNGAPTAIEQVETLVQEGQFPKDDFDSLRHRQIDLEKQMTTVFRELRNIEKKLQESLTDLDERMVMPVVDEGLEILRTTFPFEKTLAYLNEVRENIQGELDRFRKATPKNEQADEESDGDDFLEYKVNLMVDNTDTKHVPIIIETNPKHKNVFGTIERIMEKGGVWKTDFTQIKAGSLVRANGGYIVLNALDTLIEPWVWPDLKRTLRTGSLEIHTYEQAGFMSSGLKPEPIPLTVKVIMIGDSEIYQLLYFRDDDFKKIFKVRADFDFEMPKTKATIKQYLRFIRMLCDDEKLSTFDATALAQIIEFGVRLAGRQKKLSTRFNIIADVAREANYWAKKNGKSRISYDHVEKAIEERIYRVKLLEEKIQELIEDGSIMIDCTGSVVGQVNGLSVYDVGEYAFGKPSRITARTSFGSSGIINIEREAQMSGPTHNKGVAIISGFLRSRFAQQKPLAINASITFEQSYGGVDGDSASSTEIYAILSSLTDIPINQEIAVTGSVNQKGEIQPIGGVNLKIEGFFDICRARGLTGHQGVLIPKQNIPDLMLREDVIEAIRKKRFCVYAISTIDEGIEILTGVKAGTQHGGSSFELGTLNYCVNERFEHFAKLWKEYGQAKLPA